MNSKPPLKLVSKALELQWISTAEAKTQHCCFLSGPSSESNRTMHSLSSSHDLSVFNAEPGSAVLLCSTERLALWGHWRQSLHCDEEVSFSWAHFSCNHEIAEQETVESNITAEGSHVRSHSCAFLPLPLACQSLWSFSCG